MREFTKLRLQSSQSYIPQVSALLRGKKAFAFWDRRHLLIESSMVQLARTHSAAALVTASLWHWQSMSVSEQCPAGPLCTTQLNWKLLTTCAVLSSGGVSRNQLTEHSGRPYTSFKASGRGMSSACTAVNAASAQPRKLKSFIFGNLKQFKLWSLPFVTSFEDAKCGITLGKAVWSGTETAVNKYSCFVAPKASGQGSGQSLSRGGGGVTVPRLCRLRIVREATKIRAFWCSLCTTCKLGGSSWSRRGVA